MTDPLPSPAAETGDVRAIREYAQRLTEEFYLSGAYDPKAACHAETVRAAIEFTLKSSPPAHGETREEGHPHLIGGEFQSDKYPTCPRGKVPLSVKDKTAQDLLWEYAQRRRAVDAEFAADLEIALKAKGYTPPSLPAQEGVTGWNTMDSCPEDRQFLALRWTKFYGIGTDEDGWKMMGVFKRRPAPPHDRDVFAVSSDRTYWLRTGVSQNGTVELDQWRWAEIPCELPPRLEAALRARKDGA